MHIYHADHHHLEQLVPLLDAYRVFYRQKSDPALARLFLDQRLRNQDSIIFLASSQEGGMGFAQLYPLFSTILLQPMLLLNDLFVTPEYRNQGIGSSLLIRATDYATEQRAAGLLLETADTNPARRLYERLGWKRVDGFTHYVKML